MENNVYAVSGSKISSLAICEDSLKFSSQSPKSFDEFQESWTKKLSLATKVEIKFENIVSIKKEENDDEVNIKYKSFANISSDCEFTFDDKEECEEFLNYFENQLSFIKTNETLSPFKAIQGYLIGLAITVAATIFGYFLAIDLENGTDDSSSSRKGRLFKNIVGLLGDKGVLLLGLAITLFIIYQIWTRYKNPPNQIKLVRK